MNNVEVVFPSRESDLGNNFTVRRAIPYVKKRMVGPFIFLDHMGPQKLSVKEELTVLPHPHIGLSTMTYLFAGELLHRDGLGTEQVIRPGEVNWMTAGKGIAHSERSQTTGEFEGIQFWVALPKKDEEVDPSFTHLDSSEIPIIQEGNSRFYLVAGEALGKKSPVPVHSPLFCIHGEVSSGESFHMELRPDVESAVYVVRGKLCIEGETIEEFNAVSFKKGTAVDFLAVSDATVIIIGGEAFPEKRHIWWNFVASSKEMIEDAKRRWMNGEFRRVVHETQWLPLPDESSGKVHPVNYP